MMPDDQLKQFTPLETVSLFAYLAGKEQTPVLSNKENQDLFFNGKDLTGWVGDESLWSVEDGEIVGLEIRGESGGGDGWPRGQRGEAHAPASRAIAAGSSCSGSTSSARPASATARGMP